MLYLFHGSNVAKSVEKAHALIHSLRIKKPDAAFVSIDAGSYNPSLVQENLGGQGLFSGKYIIFLDRVTENAEAKENVTDFIPVMNESANIFIVLEGKLNAELKKSFEKHATKTVLSEDAETAFSQKKEFNIFALADAVGSRDSFKAWSIYREAVLNGNEPENIVGTLFWQVKSMSVAAKAKSVAEARLNPFVYNKSKKYAANYSAAELSKLLGDLVSLYHEGHRGTVDLELGIERMLLSITRQH